jgi:hypothetical protein
MGIQYQPRLGGRIGIAHKGSDRSFMTTCDKLEISIPLTERESKDDLGRF